jgi:hypothetical protein
MHAQGTEDSGFEKRGKVLARHFFDHVTKTLVLAPYVHFSPGSWTRGRSTSLVRGVSFSINANPGSDQEYPIPGRSEKVVSQCTALEG